MSRRREFFTCEENVGYYMKMVAFNVAAAIDLSQLHLCLSGRSKESVLFKAEELKEKRMEEIERRKKYNGE